MQTKENSNWNFVPKDAFGVNKVVIAFPGMGKTTYALHTPGVVDLDFGSFRSALGVSPQQQGSIYPQFVKYLQFYRKLWLILTNDPGLIPGLKSAGFQVVVNVPSDLNDLLRRVQQRDGKDRPFAMQLAKNLPRWVDDWKKLAARYQVQLVESDYLYLGQSNSKEVANHGSNKGT